MKNLIIIGAGQIGSRHLQGLAKLDGNFNISVIDPSKESLRVAKDRFFQVARADNLCEVSFQTDIPDLNGLDLAIIATSSKIRKKVITDLLLKSVPDYFILEKVAFQNLKDFEEINSIFFKKNIKAWVNCPNRVFDSYRKLKSKIGREGPISLRVTGGNWGLASNAIHYIDLFSFLTETINMQITQSKIDSKIYSSKRKGFYELGGELKIESSNKDVLILEDFKSSDDPVVLTIDTPSFEMEINESLQELRIREKLEANKEYNTSFELTNQSTLTTEIVSRILSEGKSDLIDLENSYRLHAVFIPFFISKINEISKDSIKYCPIT
tara:strand:- start:3306 stop:4280 length:975 start_codon:yes stop_codon:yes gene_type:complete